MPIIESLLDTDLYKLTMQQCIWHQFAEMEVEYRFNCRNDIDITECCEQINCELDALCECQFTKDELNYLTTLPFFKTDYIDYLRHFKLNRQYIHAYNKGKKLHIDIKGPWTQTIFFETPALAIVNECYYRHYVQQPDYKTGREKLAEKIALLQSKKDYADFHFVDFGTRRRFNHDWQEEVLKTLLEKCPQHLVGTSNIAYAKQFGIPPSGTMAHEYLQACQVLAPILRDSQTYALSYWLDEYPHQLGIALTDVVNIDAFLRDFNLHFAKEYQGLRQDSGDAFVWTEKVLAHYKKLAIDPKQKTLVYSDSLTFPKALAIYEKFYQQANMVFGIGTNLLNDLGYLQLNIVIKMTSAKGKPVAKISDSPAKAITEHRQYIEILKKTFVE